MNDKILEIISSISNKSTEELHAALEQEKLWDSLRHVELVMALESEFNIFFSQEEIATINTPAKIITAIESKVSSSGA